MLYRVHYYDEYEGSCGFEFFGSHRKACQALARWQKQNDGGYIESKTTPKTKAEIINLLNEYWGFHADNG